MDREIYFKVNAGSREDEGMEDKLKNRITVTIMGEDFVIKGSSSPRMMEKAARQVDQMMRTLSAGHCYNSRYRIAVLTAINLADELLKLKTGLPPSPDQNRERGDEDELV